MRYLVETPEPGYTGKVAGVAFADGRATVDSEQRQALAYFRRKSYRVSPSAPAAADTDDSVSIVGEPEPVVPVTPAAPTRSASKADWVKHVTSDAAGDKQLSADDAQAMTRDELAEHVLGPKEG